MELPSLVIACEKYIIPMAWESLCGWRRSAYLAASGKAGGLYDCDLANSNVKQLLRNSSDSRSEIKRLCHYGDVIVFTGIVDRKVKTFDPRTTTVETLTGTGKEGTNDGSGETCTFTQVHGICCLQTSLSLQDAVNNVSSVNEYIKSTVATVKQHLTTPWKKQHQQMVPKELYQRRHRSRWNSSNKVWHWLQNNLKSINEDYLGYVDLRTLLTTIVENLHAVSHFKYETFTALQYARDLKKSKRIIKKNAKLER